MNLVLPQIIDRDHYKILFKVDSHWEKAIHFLQNKYQLKGQFARGVLGSHIVYRVGDCWIKLMAPIFAHDMPFELSGLRAVDGRLGVATPKIIAEGILEGWPYVILSHVPGEAIRNVWPTFSLDQKLALADQMAKVVVNMSACPSDDVIIKRFQWNEFIAAQFTDWETHQKRKGLYENWLKAVPHFLQKFSIEDFQCEKTVFLHSDLTFDHFLVSLDSTPKISGVIDMADCQVGHFEYELVAPCIFIFKGQKQLLRRFLIGCGFTEEILNQRFAEKLLAWALLHRYFSFITYFQEEMAHTAAGDFSALAAKVFPL